MYVMMYYLKNDEGKTLLHWDTFEELHTMQEVYERLKGNIVGSILTFETKSAFVFNP